MTKKHNPDLSAAAEPVAPQPDTAPEPAPADARRADEPTLEDVIRQRDEYLNLLQRSRAEFDNYRRRNDALRATALEEGRQDAVTRMLGVLDNLSRALEACSDDPAKVAQGVNMIHKQFCEVLQGMGVERIADEGHPFDPNVHEAFLQEQAGEGIEPGTVTAVLQCGYTMNGRMLRPSKVKVAQ